MGKDLAFSFQPSAFSLSFDVRATSSLPGPPPFELLNNTKLDHGSEAES
jgi:hypothetical protein